MNSSEDRSLIWSLMKMYSSVRRSALVLYHTAIISIWLEVKCLKQALSLCANI